MYKKIILVYYKGKYITLYVNMGEYNLSLSEILQTESIFMLLFNTNDKNNINTILIIVISIINITINCIFLAISQ